MDHINIVVSDIAQAKSFFLDLGFQEIDSACLSGDMFSKVVGLKDIEATYVALMLPNTETKLELIQYLNPMGGKDPCLGKANQLGVRHIAFEVDNIEIEVNRLKAKGVHFHSQIQKWERSGKQLVYFWGPDGILLEMAQYEDS
jgi:catechol 2,3-dioxygenase-like lactoylglutathione lyase family enzyme